MEVDLSIVSLVVNASILVQIVMGILLLTSVISWSMIFKKSRMFKKSLAEADDFEERFWSGGDLNVLYNKITASKTETHGMSKLFEAGFAEFARMRKQQVGDPIAVLEGAQRAMRVALMRETDRLEMNLSFLATVGSTSPYVGLFGTVWGIMNSFRALGNVQQATISMVAPGIAEALIATAMGLFAAIPAVIAYNSFSSDLERLLTRYEAFSEEFSSILQRQALK